MEKIAKRKQIIRWVLAHQVSIHVIVITALQVLETRRTHGVGPWTRVLSHQRFPRSAYSYNRTGGKLIEYGGVKRPHPTIHSRHVYNTIHRHHDC